MKSSDCGRSGYMRRARLAAGFLLLAACASGPNLVVDTSDEPFECSSLAWFASSDKPVTIIEQRLHSEVMKQLLERGYTEVSEDADCLVAGALFPGTGSGSAASVGIGAGSWGGSIGTSIGVSLPVDLGDRNVSHLSIAVIEREDNREVWHGTLQSAFKTSDPAAADLAQAVRTVLASFPQAN